MEKTTSIFQAQCCDVDLKINDDTLTLCMILRDFY